jgi:hypothetical protein
MPLNVMSVLRPVLAILVVVTFALFVGGVVGLGSTLLTSVVGVVLFMALLIFASPAIVIWALILSTFVVAGLLKYFFGVRLANWLPLFFALVLFVHFLRRYIVIAFEQNPPSFGRVAHGDRSAWVVFWVAVFVCYALLANLIATPKVVQFFAGTKNYLLYWGVAGLIAIGAISPAQRVSIWKVIILVGVLQVPLVIYQHFFVATQRNALLEHGRVWDSVVGSFGGDPEGGGSSGALATYLVVAIVFAWSRWRVGLFSSFRMLIVLMSAFIAVALAEVKVFFVLFPLGLAFLYGRDLLLRPGYALAVVVFVGLSMGGLLWVYSEFLWRPTIAGTRGVSDVVARSLEYFFDPGYFHVTTGEVGRYASIKLWAEHHSTDFVGMLFGHGFGAARYGTLAIGDMALKYRPFQIEATTATGILWDIGIVGLCLLLTVLTVAVVRGLALARDARFSGEERALLRACGAGIAVVGVTLVYNKDFLYLPPTILLFMLMVGEVMAAERRVRAQSRSLAPATAHRRSLSPRATWAT